MFLMRGKERWGTGTRARRETFLSEIERNLTGRKRMGLSEECGGAGRGESRRISWLVDRFECISEGLVGFLELND